jgi:hypothetical protein
MSTKTAGSGHHQETSRSLVAELLDRNRLLLFLGILLVELVLFAVGLLTPLSGSTQQTLSNETNTLFGGVQSASPGQLVFLIFSHNLIIALLEMVPFVGAVVLLVSVYSTGLAAQAIAVTNGYPSQFGAVLFAYPYSFVELSGYAIAVGAMIMLLVSWRRGRMTQELKLFMLETLIVAAVLITAAAMETFTRLAPVLGLVLWLPVGLAVAAVVTVSERSSLWSTDT